MGLPELYPAQVGSPYTLLAAPYTSGESTMTLVDATKLPVAPNIVCLAGDVAGEFRYTGKDGNVLQGVTALPGTPAATTWPAGTFAFRGIAAYDLTSLIECVDIRGVADADVRYPDMPWIVAGACDDATEWTTFHGTLGNSTENAMGGTGLTFTPNAGQSYATFYQAISLNMSEYQEIGLWLHIDDPSNVNYIRVRLRSKDYTSTHYANLNLGGYRFPQNQGFVVIPRGRFAITGDHNWAGINRIEFAIVRYNDNKLLTVTVNHIRAYRPEYTGKVSIRFDDGCRSVYTNALPLFEQYGAKGVVSVISRYADGAGGTDADTYMTPEELRVLYDRGWDLVSHTVNHVDLTTIPLPQARWELAASQRWLVDHGFLRGSRFFVPPYYGTNADVRAAILDYYYGFARYIGGTNSCSSFTLQNPVRQYMDYTSLESTSLEDLQTLIDKAVASHAWVNLYLHEATGTNLTKLEGVLQYCQTNGVEVVPWSDVYYHLDQLGNRKTGSGECTIAAGGTSVDVTHGLATTPARVQVTPTTDTGGKRYWMSAKGASTFTISIDSAHGSDIVFDWRAEV